MLLSTETAPTQAHADSTLDFARRGEALHIEGRTEESLRVLSQGVRMHPDQLSGRLVLARVCRDMGRTEEARDWLQSVLRADPLCPSARFQLGELLEGPEGEGHFEWLREQEPWDDEYPLRSRRVPAAAPVVARVPEPPPSVARDLEDEEDDGEPHVALEDLPHVATVTLAEIYFQQGLKEQAAQIYRQLLERQPGDASARSRLKEIETSLSGAGAQPAAGNGNR